MSVDVVEKRIAVLPGDGIGPEVMNQAIKVLKAVAQKYGHAFTFENGLIGGTAIKKTGSPLPPETLELCEKSDAILLGAVGMPEFDNDPHAKVRPEQGLLGLRKALNLYLNIRPIVLTKELAHLSVLKPGIASKIDLVIYRELSSGIYFGEKLEADPKAEASDRFAQDMCKYTDPEIRRVVQMAFEAALQRTGKVCVVDKANVLATSRLWRQVAMELSEEYPGVEVEYMYVDNAAMQLAVYPGRFDVIVTSNMFGDILSDLGSALVGSLGLLPSASIGEGSALFEPVHGSYPQAAGADIANPMAMILSVKMMLEHLGMHDAARDVEIAVRKCLVQGLGTPDLKPHIEYGCAKIGDIITYLIADDELILDSNKQQHTSGTII